MAFLLVSDIHVTDKPIDSHRWGLFSWLEKVAYDKDVDEVIFLGDYTDAKDRHSEWLVNKFVHNMRNIAHTARVYLLAANHDGINLVNPFFHFLNGIDDIEFITEPRTLDLEGGVECLALPCTRDYKTDWAKLDFGDYDYIFCHQTFEGAVGENGFILPGIPNDVFGKTRAKIFSGDIHAPGFAGPIEYVGAPYHTNFACDYTPRVIYINGSQRLDLHFSCPARHTVTIAKLKDLDAYKKVNKGDQVKVRVRMRREDVHEYPALREAVKEELIKRQWEECGFELAPLVIKPKEEEIKGYVMGEHRTPEQLVRIFSEEHDLTKDQEELGVQLLWQG